MRVSADRAKVSGHIVSKEANPCKTAALLNMERPNNVSELCRFMGMVNQLGKFSPRLSELSHPLRQLMSSKRKWIWDQSNDRAFAQVKAELLKPTVLVFNDPNAKTKVSADASSYGLGAVLLQRSESVSKAVAYASRALSETEGRYAQIEKEALAVTWACERFTTYLLERFFSVETDHKPLVPLLSRKHLDDLPPRILRFRLRLARYDYSIAHAPGKLLYTADALSRAPCAGRERSAQELDDEVEVFVARVVSALPATEQRLNEYRNAQEQDPLCSNVAKYCRAGWHAKHTIESELIPYWKVRSSLSLHEGL